VINSHKTTQVVHQIINTIILNWVGQSNVDTRHTLLTKTAKGSQLPTRSYGLNATIYRP